MIVNLIKILIVQQPHLLINYQDMFAGHLRSSAPFQLGNCVSIYRLFEHVPDVGRNRY